MLTAEGLHKRYGPREAVRGLALTVRPGELLGLLGPNGAGKSTTVAMLAGLTAPDAGTITWTTAAGRVDGRTAPAAYRARIGLVPQDLALYEELPAVDNLCLFGALYGLPAATCRARAREVLERVGLADRARDRPATFSGGMKRRLNIACALMHDPDVLLLDEPTAGVDPQSRNAIFDHLEDLKRQGKALIYTTHYMEEVERLADRILVVDHGVAVADGTLAELLRRLPAAESIEFTAEGEVDTVAIAALPGVHGVERHGDWTRVALGRLAADAATVLVHLAGRGTVLRQVRSGRATLEDVFLALTGRQLRD
jgi:ABC-2 type transport system ATP-binding protein